MYGNSNWSSPPVVWSPQPAVFPSFHYHSPVAVSVGSPLGMPLPMSKQGVATPPTRSPALRPTHIQQPVVHVPLGCTASTSSFAPPGGYCVLGAGGSSLPCIQIPQPLVPLGAAVDPSPHHRSSRGTTPSGDSDTSHRHRTQKRNSQLKSRGILNIAAKSAQHLNEANDAKSCHRPPDTQSVGTEGCSSFQNISCLTTSTNLQNASFTLVQSDVEVSTDATFNALTAPHNRSSPAPSCCCCEDCALAPSLKILSSMTPPMPQESQVQSESSMVFQTKTDVNGLPLRATGQQESVEGTATNTAGEDTQSNAEHRTTQRMKQIRFGKVTTGYFNYRMSVPIFERQVNNSNHPETPRPTVECSKRAWDALVGQWRRTLHLWDDNPDPETLAVEGLNRRWELGFEPRQTIEEYLERTKLELEAVRLDVIQIHGSLCEGLNKMHSSSNVSGQRDYRRTSSAPSESCDASSVHDATVRIVEKHADPFSMEMSHGGVPRAPRQQMQESLLPPAVSVTPTDAQRDDVEPPKRQDEERSATSPMFNLFVSIQDWMQRSTPTVLQQQHAPLGNVKATDTLKAPMSPIRPHVQSKKSLTVIQEGNSDGVRGVKPPSSPKCRSHRNSLNIDLKRSTSSGGQQSPVRPRTSSGRKGLACSPCRCSCGELPTNNSDDFDLKQVIVVLIDTSLSTAQNSLLRQQPVSSQQRAHEPPQTVAQAERVSAHTPPNLASTALGSSCTPSPSPSIERGRELISFECSCPTTILKRLNVFFDLEKMTFASPSLSLQQQACVTQAALYSNHVREYPLSTIEDVALWVECSRQSSSTPMLFYRGGRKVGPPVSSLESVVLEDNMDASSHSAKKSLATRGRDNSLLGLQSSFALCRSFAANGGMSFAGATGGALTNISFTERELTFYPSQALDPSSPVAPELTTAKFSASAFTDKGDGLLFHANASSSPPTAGNQLLLNASPSESNKHDSPT